MVAEKWAISATAEVFSPLIAFLRPPTPPHLLLLYLYFVVFHCILLYFSEFLPLPRFFSPLLHSLSSPLAPLIFVFCCISLYFCNCPGFLSFGFIPTSSPLAPFVYIYMYLFFLVLHCILLYFTVFLQLPRFSLFIPTSSPLAPFVYMYLFFLVLHCISLYFDVIGCIWL